MKRYVKEMINDLVRTYPGMDTEKADRAVRAFERGYITKAEMLRLLADLADEAR